MIPPLMIMMAGMGRILTPLDFEVGGASALSSMGAAVSSSAHFGYRDVAKTITKGVQMAISEDTAALVAAQLTQAWATRAGTRDPNPRLIFEEEVLARFNHFHEQVAGKKSPTRFDVS